MALSNTLDAKTVALTASQVPTAQVAARPSWRWLAAWLLLMVLGAALLAGWRFHQLSQRFDDEARTLHRTIAQRVGQHDAHLTNLHAIAQLDDPQRATFRAVASAIQTFYPRIVAIDLMRLSPTPEVLASTRNASVAPPRLDVVAQRAATLGAGKAAMLDAPVGPGYAMVKRIGDAPLSALVLQIDAAQLLAPDGPVHPALAGAAVWLTDAHGTVFGGQPVDARDARERWPRTLGFAQSLGSTSQPLQLVLTRRLGWAELLPAGGLLALAIGGAALLWAVGSVQRVRRARREAARQAQELRLAHAMRVNGLGEMASGIAHELTQPLTAMLSQSQAGLRLIEQGADAAAMVPILQANVRLARRSGDILERIRSYVSQREPTVEAVALNALVEGVAELAQADLQTRGIALELALDPAGPMVRIDAISVEQVLHNLVRNAAEALQGQDGARITVRTRSDAAGAQVAVIDNGPGIAPEQLARVFQPFFTTKEGGMGLGLSLCERLVENIGGRIEVQSTPGTATVFTVHLKGAR
ncbi:sensor histidine kinase [Variovorax boronicumulans]|uniref:sensor histidine kinase n=1 Tax=Variovorax boronicumulans TaxID=436515 RepID=UPI001C564035